MSAEHWICDVGSDSVALLTVPPVLGRHRVFDLDISLGVKVSIDGQPSWHELTVELDGSQRWARRVSSHAPSDGLDYHCRVTVLPNDDLRIRATAIVQGAVIQRLVIEAREEL